MNALLSKSTIRIFLILLVLFAFGLRVWRLDQVPPGWRDDELIEALVISQKVLEGDIQVYYPDASGHEALYHILAAGMLLLFGPGVAGIRWLSAILGTLTIPLTYLIGRRLFSPAVGLLAAALLAVSFWSLMYSRFGIRHINMPVLMLATFHPFLKALNIGVWGAERPTTNDQRPTASDERPTANIHSQFTIHNSQSTIHNSLSMITACIRQQNRLLPICNHVHVAAVGLDQVGGGEDG
jgi:hypothetical protein